MTQLVTLSVGSNMVNDLRKEYFHTGGVFMVVKLKEKTYRT